MHSTLFIAANQGYIELVQALLLDEGNLTYYLKQIIMKPELMQFVLIENDIFLKVLMTHREKLWDQLQRPETLNLSIDEYRKVLQHIIQSAKESNIKLMHPLFLVFNEIELIEKPKDNDFKFFKIPQNSILNKIENYLNITTQEAQDSSNHDSAPAV